MSNLIPLVDLSSNLWRKVRDNWFGKVNEKKNISGESDWLAEKPSSWYQGPLIFPPFPEEGSEGYETLQTSKEEVYEEAWSD